MRAPRRSVLLAAQLAVAALVAWFVGRTLVAQWRAFSATPLETDLGWPMLVTSAALVLLTYAVLIETWRAMLRASGERLSLRAAARIWCVSNLGRYVPGKIWQITAMGMMARGAGVSATAATGTALLGTVVNIASGMAIVLALGWHWIGRIAGGAQGIAFAFIGAAIVGLASLPLVMPRLTAFVARVTGRQLELSAPTSRVIAIAVIGNVVAWGMYGVAFRWLVMGLLGTAAGATSQYIAVYTASYVVGYLFLFLPGGIGPREAVMAALLTSPALTAKQAWLVAGASRVWLTILEIVPGLLFVASDAARRRGSSQLHSDVPTE